CLHGGRLQRLKSKKSGGARDGAGYWSEQRPVKAQGPVEQQAMQALASICAHGFHEVAGPQRATAPIGAHRRAAVAYDSRGDAEAHPVRGRCRRQLPLLFGQLRLILIDANGFVETIEVAGDKRGTLTIEPVMMAGIKVESQMDAGAHQRRLVL